MKPEDAKARASSPVTVTDADLKRPKFGCVVWGDIGFIEEGV
jgi:hypothetical protein